MATDVKALAKIIGALLTTGGAWAPLTVFAAHLMAAYVFLLYERWPPVDIPLHFFGGAAIAFFVSRCVRTWLDDEVDHTRRALLELLLAFSLTATAAVFWEFAEYASDHLLGTLLQFGLTDTMKDMAIGVGGGLVFVAIRARQLRVGHRALREVTVEWLRRRAA
jgi:uncharacterized membrane protein